MRIKWLFRQIAAVFFLLFTLLLAGSIRRPPVKAAEELPEVCRAAASFASELPESDQAEWLKMSGHNGAILLRAALTE